MTIFVGEVDQHRFVAGQAKGDPKQFRLTQAMLEVAPPGPTRLPVFNAAGWAIHVATEALSPEELSEKLKAIVPEEEVLIIDEEEAQLRKDMERFLGREMIDAAFRPLAGRIPEAEPADVLHAI